jgi:LysM repeat protein
LTLSPALRYNRSPSEGRSAVIPFPSHARASDDSEILQSQRRRREQRDVERAAPARRVRRRRNSAPWLQRNALSVAAVSVLVALLGFGFGLVQMLNRPDTTPTTMALAIVDTPVPNAATGTVTTLNAASIGPSVQVTAGAQSPDATGAALRQIQTTSKVLDANYTIAQGDTLVKIAQKFNTTVERIQAFNNLSDPRALRIGTKLVIPPPLG